jgi:hypothetical protein
MGIVAIVPYPSQDSGQGDSYDESGGAQPQQGYGVFAGGFSEHGGPPRRPRTGIIVAVSLAAVAAVVAAIVIAIVVMVKAAPGSGSTGGSQSTATLNITASPGAPSSPADAEEVTTAFLQAWSSGDMGKAAGLTDDPSAARAALTAYGQDLNMRKLTGIVTGSAAGAPGASPDIGAAAASTDTVTVQLTAQVAASSSPTAATGTRSYQSTLVAYQRADGPGWVIQ